MLSKFIGDKAFYRKVMIIVLPIMLQNALTNLVSMVDNIMVGTLGTEQLSAVAIVNQLLFVFNLAVFGITAGVGIFTAQYYGKGDNDGIRSTVRLKFVLSIILLFAAILLFQFAGSFLIESYLHDGDQNMNLELAFAEGKRYLSIMLIGLIPFVISQVYGGTLREVEKTAFPMVASLIAVAVNLTLNYVFIFSMGLGVAGAAIATVISRFVECFAIIIFVAVNKNKSLPFMKGIYSNFVISSDLVKRVLPKALPLLANEFCWSLGIALLNYCYSLRGLDVVAATNITSTISNLFNVSTISFGTAISIIIGGLLGAGKIEEAKRTNIKLTFTSFVISIIFGIVLFFASDVFPQVYNTTPQVKELASTLIKCYVFYLPMSSLMNSFYFAMRSGGKTVITFLFDSVYMIFVSVPFTLIIAKLTSIHIIGVYALSLGIEIFKVVLGFILIIQGKWMQNIVDTE